MHTDDGYRLTYGGYDFLAMRTFARRGSVHSVGNQIGVGKESDIYVVADEDDNQLCCKIHRFVQILKAVCFILRSLLSSKSDQQVGKDIIPVHQVEARLFEERSIGQLDVHVQAFSYQGVCLHEGGHWCLSLQLYLKLTSGYKVLHENGFPVPRPVDQARHCIIMELIDAFPL